ncbi:hypothetical protein WN943_010572 [Citrus x changshan-huyou]
MFRLICKTLVDKQKSVDLSINYVRDIQTQFSLSSISKPTNQQSLTVSFLTNSCGLSLEKAISVAKVINIRNTVKPNSVLQLLTSRGFEKSQIATLISKNPTLLLADPEKSLRPKIDYFESVGISGADLPKFLCSNKQLLVVSLKSNIIPIFEFLKGLVQTNVNLVRAVKQSSRIINCNIEKRLAPNVNTLRVHGVPEHLIAKLIMINPSSLIKRRDLFKTMMDVIKKIGIEPTNFMFILAVRSMSVLSKANWEKKKDVLMSFSWSEDEFYLAFKRQPMLMLSSTKKIRELMDFFVNEIGLKPLDIVRCPNLLLISLKKRVLPRWSVLQVLMSKNLLKKDIDFIQALIVTKPVFERRFVTSYMDDSEVMMAYRDGLRVQAVVADYFTADMTWADPLENGVSRVVLQSLDLHCFGPFDCIHFVNSDKMLMVGSVVKHHRLVTAKAMFSLICKTLIEKPGSIDLKISYARNLKTMIPSVNSVSKPSDERSPTVSFLTHSCGLSLEKAISVSKLVKIQDTEKPNSSIQLLTSRGFTKPQIATLISKYPRILSHDPEKVLKPKIEYLESLGISGPDLAKILCPYPDLLSRSLENHIIPTFDFLKGVFQANGNLVYALKQSIRVVNSDIQKRVVPNMNTLRAHGVPEPHIARLIMLQPPSLVLRAELFKNVVDVIKEMGFEPSSKSFILAVRSMAMSSKATWQRKKEILISFGWSEDEFRMVFKRQPLFMMASAKKIRKLMDFFVNKIGLEPSDIARYPNLLIGSLEKKVLPRWSVLQVLMSKNLLKKDVNVSLALFVTKEVFERRFVTSYMHEPEVMTAYQGGLGVQAVGGGVGAELSQT